MGSFLILRKLLFEKSYLSKTWALGTLGHHVCVMGHSEPCKMGRHCEIRLLVHPPSVRRIITMMKVIFGIGKGHKIQK